MEIDPKLLSGTNLNPHTFASKEIATMIVQIIQNGTSSIEEIFRCVATNSYDVALS